MMHQSSMPPDTQTPPFYSFDYQADFTQFLEEARNCGGQETPNTAHLQADTRKQLNGDIKKKKSWKGSLFSWLKKDKKKESTNGIRTKKPNRRLFSGPVHRSEPLSVRPQRAASGQLNSLCISRRAEDYEVPYISLRQLSNPQRLQYGPVYLVT